MIYIVSGNDSKNKNIFLKGLYNNNLPILLSKTEINKSSLFEQASSVSLFGETPIVLIENGIKEINNILKEKDIDILNQSKTIFIFLEDKVLVSDLKRYKKDCLIKDFNIDNKKQISQPSIFNIADSFSQRDKINTWILFRNAISTNISPEEISGIIFWKIKTMILNGNKNFSINELKNMSSKIVSLYHNSHKGDVDFTVGLEEFILSSLSK